MKKTVSPWPRLAALGLAAAAVGSYNVAAQDRVAEEPPPAALVYEEPPVLRTADVLGESLMRGRVHRLHPTALTDGYMAHFIIESDYGAFECVGVDETRQRIHEAGAIARLAEVSKSDVFADAVKQSIEQPIDAAKEVIKHPKEAVKQVPKTVGHFFKRLGSAIGQAADEIKDRVEERGTDEPPAPRESVRKKISDGFKGGIGFDKAKLECARQLGVDPYTDNEELQERLDKVAWVYFAGGLPVNVGVAAASGGASLAVAATGILGRPEELFTLTPDELAYRNRESLRVLSVPEEMQKRFMETADLSLSQKRAVLLALEGLAPAENRASIVDLALRCHTQDQARFLARALELLAARQRSGESRYTRLVVAGRVPAALEAGGALHVPALVDCVSWTEEVADFARRGDLRSQRPVLLLSGQITDRALLGFKENGWTLVRPNER